MRPKTLMKPRILNYLISQGFILCMEGVFLHFWDLPPYLYS